MSYIIVTLIDNMTGKEMGWFSTQSTPRKGEIIIINNIKFWVETVSYRIRRNLAHKDQFVFEGIEVIVDTASQNREISVKSEKVSEK